MISWKTVIGLWHKIGFEAALLMAGQALVALGGLVSIRFLTTYLPNEAYGLGWLYINAVGLAAMFLANPLGQALNRYYHDDGGQEQLDRLLGLIWRMEIGITLAGVGIYAVLVIALGLLNGSEWLVYGIMPLYFFFLAFLNTTQMLLNTSRKRVRRFVLMVMLAWLNPAAAIMACVLWEPGVNAFVLGYAASTILISTVGMTWMTGYGSRLPHRLPVPDWDYMRGVLAYSLPWIGFYVCGWILALSDRYLINWFLGAALTGTYIAAYQVGSALFQLLGGAFGPLVQPIIFQKAGESNKSGAEGISAGVRVFAWVSLPVLGVFIIMRVWLMRWLVDSDYWGGNEAVLWVGLGVYFWVLGNLGMDAFLVAKRSGTILKINAASAAVNIMLNLILIPRLGIVGAGVSTCIAFAFYMVNMIGWGRRLLPWRFPVRTYAVVACIVTVAVLSGKLAHSMILGGHYSIPAAIAVFAIFTVVLVFCGWLSKSRLRRDYNIVLGRA